MKTLRVTLELEVVELSADDREEAADGSGMAADELPGLDDTDAGDLAEQLFERDMEPDASELLAGSDMFVGLKEATVITAEWVDGSASGPQGDKK